MEHLTLMALTHIVSSNNQERKLSGWEKDRLRAQRESDEKKKTTSSVS